MASIQKQTMYFWAICPHCSEHSPNKSFNVQVTVEFRADFDDRSIAASATPDLEPLVLHMASFHPDLVLAGPG